MPPGEEHIVVPSEPVFNRRTSGENEYCAPSPKRAKQTMQGNAEDGAQDHSQTVKSCLNTGPQPLIDAFFPYNKGVPGDCRLYKCCKSFPACCSSSNQERDRPIREPIGVFRTPVRSPHPPHSHWADRGNRAGWPLRRRSPLPEKDRGSLPLPILPVLPQGSAGSDSSR